MRVGFISTYPPTECGIATYTQYLTEALRKQRADVYVISHIGGSGFQVFPSFDYEDPDLAERAFSAMIRFTPDVVHVQHEFGLYGKDLGVNVVPLILKFRLIGIPVVTTLHTVYPNPSENHLLILDAIIQNSTRIIVHDTFQKQILCTKLGESRGEKIHIIPHGARELEPIQNAKEILGLPRDKKVVLLIGYFRPSKNFELIVDLFPQILKEFPDVILVVAGKIRGKEFIDYRNMLFQRIESSPARENIYLIRGQLPQNVFDTILSSADVVVLPYQMTSQSGILAHSLAFHRPIVASNSIGVRSVIERSGAGLIASNPDEFVESIVRILRDEDLARTLSDRARAYVKDVIGWSLVAQKHLDIYRDVTETPSLESRIIWVD
jgi:glycosyltransferase involved in cell wall biosynthesis